jgi:predicted GTPase
MTDTKLAAQLQQLRTWQQARLRQLARLRPWLSQQGLATPSAELAIEQAVEAIRDDQVTIAVAGDCARGKTELLNALFFSDLGGRLLPSDGGRSTQCPTLLHYNPRIPPRLRLLPISTRADERPLEALCQEARHWLNLPLAIDDPDAMAEALAYLTEQTEIDAELAASLGLSRDGGDTAGTRVTVPRWRMAELNVPHPLLRSGLRILDTPGLEAFTNEPALASTILPTADAVLFVVSAETGVTPEDLSLWKHFVNESTFSHNAALTVVLNKTDRLWSKDESPHQVTQSIIGQCRMTARRLQVEEQQVFAVSAQKALVARCTHDTALEQRSGIAELESHLGQAIRRTRRQSLRKSQIDRVSHAIRGIHESIEELLRNDRDHFEKLRLLTQRSDREIERRLETARADRRTIHEHSKRYTLAGELFHERARLLLGALDPAGLDILFARIRTDMADAWTTHGLRTAMQQLENDTCARLQHASNLSQRLRRFARSTYRHFGFRLQRPFDPITGCDQLHYQVRARQVIRKAERERKGHRQALMTQEQLILHYFDTVADPLRAILVDAHRSATDWAATIMAPLAIDLETRRRQLADHIESLQTAVDSRTTVQRRLEALQRENARRTAQVATLKEFRVHLERESDDPSPMASGQN